MNICKNIFHFLVFISTTLIVLMCFSSSVGAFVYDGNATPINPGDMNGTGGYGIAGSVSANRPAGYRFTVVDKVGTAQGNNGSIDIFRNQTCVDDGWAYDNYQKFPQKYNKARLNALYQIIGKFETTNSKENCFRDTNLGLTLPEFTTELETWCTRTNIKRVLENGIGGVAIGDLSDESFAVLIEPIYFVKLKGEYHSLTTTEIAAYGAWVFGAEQIPLVSANKDSWGWISNATNKLFPNSLYLTNSYFGLGSATELTKNASFETIIKKGYGAALIYEENIVEIEKTLTVVYHSNFADGIKYKGEKINEKTLISDYKQTFQYSTTYRDGLLNANNPDWLYLTKTGYKITGYWIVGSSFSDQKISQSFGGTGQELAKAMGFENGLDDGSITVHVFAEWEPINYTVVYEGNGATGGSTASSTHTYDVAKALTPNGFTKTGHTFVKWNMEPDGSGVEYEDELRIMNAAENEGDVITLYAQWAPNKLTVNYYSNYADQAFAGAVNEVGPGKNVIVRTWNVPYNKTSWPDSLHNYSADTSATHLARTGYIATGYWNTKADGTGISIHELTDFSSAEELANALGVSIKDGDAVVEVYAQWEIAGSGDDYPPVVHAVDRWFSLDEAKLGNITLDELMKTAEAVDSLVGDVTDFNVEGTFTILGYDESNKDALADEFKKFTASGSATVTYHAIDKAGNAAYCTVIVHIVAQAQQHTVSTGRFVRFISANYYEDDDGDFVAEDAGGLYSGSVWIMNDEYQAALTATFDNVRDKDTGVWQTVYQTWTFTKEQVAEAKQYVNEHGLGKTKSDDALMGFFNRFKVW